MSERVQDVELAAIKAAYFAMLMIPHSSPIRVELQSAMCMLRDQIANITNANSLAVQNEFEALASIWRKK